MDTNRFNREDYVFRIAPIRNEEDAHRCLQFLTDSDRHRELCRNEYGPAFIKTVVEASDALLYYTRKDAFDDIVCFALVRVHNSALEILLLCAIPNTENYGQMIAYSTHMYAVQKRCKKIYVVPRTSQLRETFVKYGYEHTYGIEGLNEVMKKRIVLPEYARVSTTRRRRHRPPRFRNRTYRINATCNTAIHAEEEL